MRKKHVVIEILPRLLWIIEGSILYITHNPFKYTFTINQNITYMVVGIFLVISGLLSFIWTIRFVAKALITKKLITDGPYKYSRHPMYVAIYMTLIGVGVLYFSTNWFIILAAFIPIWYIDCLLEESQMIDIHGNKYIDYKNKTRMFL